MECVLRWLDDLDGALYALRMVCTRNRALVRVVMIALLILAGWQLA